MFSEHIFKKLVLNRDGPVIRKNAWTALMLKTNFISFIIHLNLWLHQNLIILLESQNSKVQNTIGNLSFWNPNMISYNLNLMVFHPRSALGKFTFELKSNSPVAKCYVPGLLLKSLQYVR